MAFSLFGKKPGNSPAPPRATASSPVPAARRVGGVADYFAGGGGASGRFAARANKAKPGERRGSAYSYGSEVNSNTVPSIASSVAPVAAPWRPSDPTSAEAPMTEAAFTQLPSSLDVGDMPRRRAALSQKDLPVAIEDCALSFANGRAAEALARIESAIAAEDLGQWALQAWLLRFDLFEHLGLRARFEAEALSFAQRFERSPPMWPERGASDEAARDASVPTVSISGQLSAASAAPLSALRKTVERYEGVVLDFSRLTQADRHGCRCLLVTLQSLKRSGKTVALANEDVLLEHIRAQVRPGDRTSDATTWLLYLEVMQVLGRQDEFEQAAIDYATTFEVSPPSWQSAPPKRRAAAPDAVGADRFYLQGELIAPCQDKLSELAAYAEERPLVVLDLGRLTRIDFVSGSQLVHLLGKLQQAGKAVELRSANEMVGTLLLLMGATEVARVVARRG